ncbi:MAG: MBOAT family protein [Acidobacteriota bacterium]|nr:MBOAT family protein [Acidobacteriota bacterium]
MIFHSLDFVAFFLVTCAIYWMLPHRAQNVFLVAAGCFFYGYVHPWFLLPLVCSASIDFFAAIQMERHPPQKRAFLLLSLISNLGLLGFFKYFDFFIENVAAAARLIGLDFTTPALRIILPVGISFYTFQALSYTIDVYRGKIPARRSYLTLAAFVTFFPPLVAGPIERASHLMPQIESRRRFDIAMACDAVFLILWGYFKKLVIADNLGVIVNKVFGIREPSFEMLWAGVFAFTIQIFADFSAYSDIARGVARWFGFELIRNFDHPYLARGPADFWRRWHISLSSWFRDYVYIPLGGGRSGPVRRSVNLILTFLLSGLWHGASWNFVLWGLYHGLLVAGSRAIEPITPRTPARWHSAIAPLQVALTFVLVMFGWLLFRETDASYLLRYLTLTPFGGSPEERRIASYLFVLTWIYAAPIAIHMWWDTWFLPRFGAVEKSAARLTFETLCAGALFALLLVFRSRTSMDFIYFQF